MVGIGGILIVLLGIATSILGMAAIVMICSGAVLRRAPRLPRAVEELAAALGLQPVPPEGPELAGLVGAGLLSPEVPVIAAVRWQAPDATFTAFVVPQRRGSEGFVVVTPQGAGEARPRLADFARRVLQNPTPLPLPGDLGTTDPEVRAMRLGARLVVRRPDVNDGKALERLIMCACAILDG